MEFNFRRTTTSRTAETTTDVKLDVETEHVPALLVTFKVLAGLGAIGAVLWFAFHPA